MELTDRLSTLPIPSQTKAIERVFQKLWMAFGNQMAAKWQGLDMQDVYQDWVEALQCCTLGAIGYGLEMSKQAQHPPNQGEFLTHCKAYRPPELVKLEKKLSPEQVARNKIRAAEMAASFLQKARAA